MQRKILQGRPAFASKWRWVERSIYVLVFMFALCGNVLYAQLPTGFTAKKLTGDNINEATSMAHAADGRIFIAERSGTVKVLQNGAVSTVHTVATTTADEQGLLGITLHPNFAQNGQIYIFYTNAAKTIHYLDRIVVSAANQVTSVTRIMEFDPIINGFHNGGAILFKNGLLYVAIGESNSPSEAAKLDTYRGKILRLTEDGQPAPGNPYYNEAGASRQKRSIWAIGMRNPWKMSLDPLSQKIFVVNVGGNYEELDDVTSPDPAKNYNYGWDQAGRSGPEQAANTITAAFYYGHDGWGCAITSGTFFNPTATNYPAEYKGRFFFTDWCSGWLRTIDGANPVLGQWQEFSASGFGSILGTSVGIDGNIYYFKYNTTGSLWRLEYSNTQAPTVVNQPASKTVIAGDAVSFSVGASGALPFTYQWQKNTVNINGATGSTYSIAATTTADAGTYRCIVKNAFGEATSNNATLTVQPFNARPVADITAPLSSLTWSVGNVVNYAGTATDAEDGVLPASAFNWEVRFFHKDGATNEHWHPGPAVASGVRSGSFTADNGGETSPNVWLRLILTVTDANGRTGKDSVDILPNKVQVTALTNVPGLKVILAAQATTPITKTLVVNGIINLQAITPQTLGNDNYAFESWNHGGAASQVIRVPAVNTTYQANYVRTGSIQNPYGGTPWNIPGKIEAEDFDTGGQSIAYNDLSTGNAGNGYRTTEDVDIQGASEGGYNIGWVANTEWLEYTVNVSATAVYRLDLRIATQAAGKTMHVELDGQNISGAIALPNTGGFQTWQTVSFTPSLPAGQKVLRVVFDSDDINFNYIEAALPGSTPPTVSLTAPANNATFTVPTTINLAATAADADGTIAQVTFFKGTELLGTDTSAPYTFAWTNATTGTHTLTARATDNNGLVTVSTPVTISVNDGTVAVNLALNKEAIASSIENGGTPASGAVDGNATGTRWSSEFSDPQWIYVDLLNTYDINRVKITWENARAVNYYVQVSNDAVAWDTVKIITNNTQLVNDHPDLSARGRYVRIFGTTRSTQYGYSIFELEVYGKAVVANNVLAADIDNSSEDRFLVAYPNPTSGQLTVRYTLPAASTVELSLAGAQGSKIKTLVSGKQPAGEHEATVDLQSLPAGLYYVTMKHNGTTRTRKVVKK